MESTIRHPVLIKSLRRRASLHRHIFFSGVIAPVRFLPSAVAEAVFFDSPHELNTRPDLFAIWGSAARAAKAAPEYSGVSDSSKIGILFAASRHWLRHAEVIQHHFGPQKTGVSASTVTFLRRNSPPWQNAMRIPLAFTSRRINSPGIETNRHRSFHDQAPA